MASIKKFWGQWWIATKIRLFNEAKKANYATAIASGTVSLSCLGILFSGDLGVKLSTLFYAGSKMFSLIFGRMGSKQTHSGAEAKLPIW